MDAPDDLSASNPTTTASKPTYRPPSNDWLTEVSSSAHSAENATTRETEHSTMPPPVATARRRATLPQQPIVLPYSTTEKKNKKGQSRSRKKRRSKKEADGTHVVPAIVVEGTEEIRKEIKNAQFIESKFKRLRSLHLTDWVKCVAKIGEFFHEQKAMLPHGRFLSWITSNFPIDRKTANNYIAVYAQRDAILDGIKWETVSHMRAAYDVARRANRTLKGPPAARIAKEANEETVSNEPDTMVEGVAVIDAEATPLNTKQRDPVLVITAPNEVIAHLLEAAKTEGADYPHQVIRDGGEIGLNAYFKERLYLDVE